MADRGGLELQLLEETRRGWSDPEVAPLTWARMATADSTTFLPSASRLLGQSAQKAGTSASVISIRGCWKMLAYCPREGRTRGQVAWFRQSKAHSRMLIASRAQQRC